jgi:hypothetical protein
MCSPSTHSPGSEYCWSLYAYTYATYTGPAPNTPPPTTQAAKLLTPELLHCALQSSRYSAAAHHKPVELPALAQRALQQPVVGAGGRAVDGVVGAHNGPHPLPYAGLKGGQVGVLEVPAGCTIQNGADLLRCLLEMSFICWNGVYLLRGAGLSVLCCCACALRVACEQCARMTRGRGRPRSSYKWACCWGA